MGYVIGIDGGGTKTECLVLCLSSQTSFSVRGEGCNPQVVGYVRMKDTITHLLREVMEKQAIAPSEIRALCAGIAGAGRPKEHAHVLHVLQHALAEMGISAGIPVVVHHDAHIALRGALSSDQKSGILLVAGTGSMAYGIRSDGASFRSGGWGHVLGDEGSGYAIGLQALQAICRACDLREQPTQLTQLILASCQLTSEQDLIGYMYAQPREKSEIARFAKLVIEAAEQGDEVATVILSKAADELVLHIGSLHKQMGAAGEDPLYPIVTAGSIMDYSSFIKQRIRAEVTSRELGVFQERCGSPAEGAVRIAREWLNRD